MIKRYFSIFVFCFLVKGLSFGQAITLMEAPADYSPPLDYYFSGANNDLNLYINNQNLKPAGDKRSRRTWIIINDREGNIAYNGPSVTSGTKSTLGFLESFAVSEVKGSFAHIFRIDGGVPHGKEIPAGAIAVDMGWVERSTVLQWGMGLVDSKSKISLKAILLNKAEDIKNLVGLSNKEIVRIYDSPYSKKTLGDRNIYEIFYILKKENGRALLSTEYQFGSSPKTNIIGWVDLSRLSKWNTRIALEPNHNIMACEERKADENKRVSFFANSRDANQFLKTGDKDNILFSQDPVAISPEFLAKSNPRRYKGSILRYPILANPGNNLFQTGIIGKVTTVGSGQESGSIDPAIYSKIVEAQRKRSEDNKIVNIFFLIEGSTEMNTYKSQLADLIDKLPTNFPGANIVNVGCGIYRNFQSNQVPFTFRKLTQNRKDVAAFIDKEVFYRPLDDDRETVFRFALKKTLEIHGGFQPGQRNILMIIGNAADFSNNTVRKLKTEKKEYLISGNEMGSIYKALADLDMNIIFIQPHSEEGRFSRKFQSDGLELMGDVAGRIFSENEKISQKLKINLNGPEMPECQEGKLVEATGGVNYFGFYSAPISKELSPAKLMDEIKISLDACNKLRNSHIKANADVIEKGKSLDVSPGEFKAYFMRFIKQELEDIDPASITKLLQEKYQLFIEAYLPKHFNGAKYDSYSYVMFLPKNELYGFIQSLNDVAGKYNQGYSMSELRQSLKDAVTELVLTVSSQNDRSRVGQLDMSSTLEIILGLKEEGVVLFQQYSNKKLADLTKKGVFPDEEVSKLAKGFSDLKLKLEDIYKSGSRYEFCFRTQGDNDNIYFWIALEDIFDKSFF
ncbi:MAG TPA: hypothetical protein PL069_00510 [Saprospiraceae bacterium]|nr:hypothetical protein [Saprospiraceae bacterium]